MVSSKLLRGCGCGQIDVGIIDSEKIHLVECKSGEVVSGAQYRRLKRSAQFLSFLFNLPAFIEIFAKKQKV